MVVLIKPSSSLCNMKCGHCFYHDESERRVQKNYGLMSLSTANELIRKVLQVCGKTCTFAFQGGEPTLRGYTFFEEFIKIVKTLNTQNTKIQYSIQTNGLAITKEWAAFFREHDFLVGLSIDGMDSINNITRIDQQGSSTLHRSLEAAEIFTKHKVAYNILCVVSSYNAKKPDRVYKFFRSHGFGYLQFIPCLSPLDNENTPYTLKPDSYAFFLKGIFDNWYHDLQKGEYVSIRMFDNILNMLCGYPPENCAMKGKCSVNLVVEADGSIFPCDFYAVDEWWMGNIHENSIKELLSNPKATQFSARTAQTPKCFSCQYFQLCRGGCPRDSEPLSQHATPYFCSAMNDFFNYSLGRFVDIVQRIKTGKTI